MAAPSLAAPPSWISLRAVAWVLDEAENVPPQLVSLMIGFGRHADDDGRNSYPSNAKLSAYTRKSVRQVKKDIALALSLELIRIPHDQSAAEHIRADRRPIVYDMAYAPMRPHEGNLVTPRESDITVNGVSHTTRRTRPPEPTGGTTRHVVQDRTGCRTGSHGVSHSSPEEDRRNPEQEEIGGTLPPDPLRPERTQAPAPTDHIDPLTAVPDLNDTKKVTSQTRTRNETVNRPILAIIGNDCTECGTILEPDGSCFRCRTWIQLAPTIQQITTAPTSTGATA